MRSVWQTIYRTLASVRTGITLIILVGIFSAVGTFVLQRPTSDAEDLQRAYSPTTLMWLDRLALTDVFHAWWFLALMTLFSLSLIFVSLDRWPNAWRFYSRPYMYPEPHFRGSLANKVSIPITDANHGIDAAQRALNKLGQNPQRIKNGEEVSLYSERNRFSVFAIYVVHFSLLLIFSGGILDGVAGYRGFMAVPEGDTVQQIALRQGANTSKNVKQLPFAIRCDAAGQDQYADGSPKRWWSKLSVIQNGREVKKKEIEVNDPLVFRGIRVYQASMGQTGKLQEAKFIAIPSSGGERKSITANLKEPVQLDANTSLKIERFVPDYYVQDGEVFTKSEDPNNPAFLLAITANGQTDKVWLMPTVANSTAGQKAPYVVGLQDMAMAKFTGLEVSYQPGQWAVWAGVLLMAIGMYVAFYLMHTRLWVVTTKNAQGGTELWVGGMSNKHRERFQQKFQTIVDAIRREVSTDAPSIPEIKQEAHESDLAKV